MESDPVPLKLESVLFTLYYPTNKSDVKKGKKKHPYWFVRPFVSTAKGYAKLAEISSTFAGKENVFGNGKKENLWLTQVFSIICSFSSTYN